MLAIELKLGVQISPLFLSCSAYQQGVDMNLGDYDGRTALHLAAAEGHARCVKFLLDTCGVKHDPKDRCLNFKNNSADRLSCVHAINLLGDRVTIGLNDDLEFLHIL